MESDIKKAGFKSYFIVSGTSIKNYHETKISGSKTKFLIDNCSTWKRFLNYKNKHVSSVMLFGDMLYLVNHGTDIETDAFISPFVKSYYYLGSGFIGNYDTFFFPVYATNVIYSRDPKNPANVIYNWTTKFFQKQLERMASSNTSIKPLHKGNETPRQSLDNTESSSSKQFLTIV